MTHSQIIKYLVLTLLVTTSTILNGLYFYNLGGWLLVPIGIAIQGLALMTAAELNNQTYSLRLWFGLLIICSCLVVSAYSARGVLTLNESQQVTQTSTQLNLAIQSLDNQLDNLSAKGVVTAAEPLRLQRAELMEQLQQETQAPIEFTMIAVMLGLLIDLGSIFLVASPSQGGSKRLSMTTEEDTPPQPSSELPDSLETPLESQSEVCSNAQEQGANLSLVGGSDIATNREAIREHEAAITALVLELLNQGVSQRVIAARVGISQSSVSRIKKAA